MELRDHRDKVWNPSLLHGCATSRAVTLKLFDEIVFDTPSSGAHAIRIGLKKILRDNYRRAIRDPNYVSSEPINSQQYQVRVLMGQTQMYGRLREAGHRDP